MLIYLDAGHGEGTKGQRDPGAVGPTGLTENRVVLDVVQRLAHLLREQGHQVKGATVGKTTDSENLIEAYRAANAAGAELLISLHCNAAVDRRAKGFEVLYRRSDSRPLAQTIIREIQTQVADGASKWLPDGLPSLVSRGVKLRENLGILNGANMPAVLVELAFISNPAEEKALKDRNVLQAFAQAIADAVTIWNTHR